MYKSILNHKYAAKEVRMKDGIGTGERKERKGCWKERREWK